MSYHWYVSEQYRNLPVIKHFASLDIAKNIPGQYVSGDPVCRVFKAQLDGKTFYLKYYLYGGKNLRRYFLRSRVRAEWENLNFFQSLGIPTANIVVFGEERVLGFFRQGLFVTEAITDSCDLEDFAKNNSELMKQLNWVRIIIKNLADYTAKLHQNNFVHRDLKWRNILIVNHDVRPKLYFIDCPSGAKFCGFLLQRAIIKDLATLDSSARKYLSKTARLRFYYYYKGITKLDTEDKRFIKKILQFFDKKI